MNFNYGGYDPKLWRAKNMKATNQETQNINSPGWDGLDATPNPNQTIEPT